MKFILNIVMVIGLLTTQAQASTREGLKAAFDDLNYALTVEWDQKDEAFYHQQIEAFKAQLLELKDQGVSNEELLNHALAEVKDPAVSADIREALALTKSSELSQEQVNDLLTSIADGMNAKGTSWVGTALYTSVAVVTVLVVTAIVLGQDFNSSRSNKDKR